VRYFEGAATSASPFFGFRFIGDAGRVARARVGAAGAAMSIAREVSAGNLLPSPASCPAMPPASPAADRGPQWRASQVAPSPLHAARCEGPRGPRPARRRCSGAWQPRSCARTRPPTVRGPRCAPVPSRPSRQPEWWRARWRALRLGWLCVFRGALGSAFPRARLSFPAAFPFSILSSRLDDGVHPGALPRAFILFLLATALLAVPGRLFGAGPLVFQRVTRTIVVPSSRRRGSSGARSAVLVISPPA
jgi:hypothetical protein